MSKPFIVANVRDVLDNDETTFSRKVEQLNEIAFKFFAASPVSDAAVDATDVQLKEVARLAWMGAANAYRMYPNNKHTFSDYWNNFGKTDCDKLFPPPTPTNVQEQGQDERFSYEDMMDIAGWMAAADPKRPIPELKEEAEVYIKAKLAARNPA